jgi:hypothetical protein
MAELPDHERVRRLMREFDARHRDSQNIRRRIDEIRNYDKEWPNSRVSGLIDFPSSSSDSKSETSS